MDTSFHFGVKEKPQKPQAAKKQRGGIDRTFLIITLLLTALGCVMIASAGSAYAKAQYGNALHFLTKQVMFAAVGISVMLAVSRLNVEFFYKYAYHIYCTTIILLVLVLIVGVSLNGAKRWLSLGFTTFQPSELAKLSLVLAMARYFTDKGELILGKRGLSRFVYDTVIPFCFIGVFCGLIALEKHLSAIVITGAIGILMMFIFGTRIKNLVSVGSAGALGLTAFALFTDYTKKRIDIWRNPELYPRDGGWQTIQGQMAIGSGGFFGLGLGSSRLKYSYVSEPANDFIFTIICEELGFIGALLILSLFAFLIFRAFTVATRVSDTYSRLISIGIAGKVAIQTLLNICVVTNTLPNTGIALPFFSYGGTSLIILLFEMGIILCVSRKSSIIK